MAAAPDPDEVLRSTAGKGNFQRVTRLLIAGGTSLLREIFDAHCPPSDLPTLLRNPVTEKQLKAAKLTKPQWDCLYPSPGVHGESTDFDVTLLFRLLSTICGLTPPGTGWDVLPSSSDHSLTAELARIKYYRNSVYGHVNQSKEVTDDEFPSLWQEISGAFVRIAGQISAEREREWQGTVDNFLKDPLTSEDERNAQELDRWYKDDMEVKKSIERLNSTTNEVREGIDRLEISLGEKMDQLQDQLTAMQQLIGKLSSTASTRSAGGVEELSPKHGLTHFSFSFCLKIAADVLKAGEKAFKAFEAFVHGQQEQVKKAVRSALEAPGIHVDDITVGSILVNLRCSSKQRFLEFLLGLRKKEVKKRLENQLKCIGFKEEVEVTIINRDEVDEKFDEIRTSRYTTEQEQKLVQELTARHKRKNQKLLDTVDSEETGTLEILHQTKANQSIAEGEGLNDTFAGHETDFTLTTKTAEGRQCYNKRDRVTVEIRDERGRECGTEVRISDNKNGQYEISYSLKKQGRYSIIIKVNGQHVRGSPYDLLVKAREQAVSSGNLSARGKNSVGHSPSPSASRYFSQERGACSQGLLIKPFQFKPVLSFGMKGSSPGMFNYPWGVAVSDTDEIAVTDLGNHRVQIYDSGGNHLRSFGSRGTNQGEFNYPHGICFDNNRNIFVADCGNHRIQIFDGEGRYMGMFGGKGSLDSELSNPWGLSLDAEGNIIVADTGNKLIKIFSNNGKFIRKIGRPGSFSDPVHCVQCDESLIVSDRGQHCIKVFSTEGEYQCEFGQQGGGDGELNWPRCLAVTKSKHLMVCDWGDERIQVFELNGKFVGKLGESTTPISVAVLTNGRIVVSDSGGNCIQMFECKLPSAAK